MIAVNSYDSRSLHSRVSTTGPRRKSQDAAARTWNYYSPCGGAWEGFQQRMWGGGCLRIGAARTSTRAIRVSSLTTTGRCSFSPILVIYTPFLLALAGEGFSSVSTCLAASVHVVFQNPVLLHPSKHTQGHPGCCCLLPLDGLLSMLSLHLSSAEIGPFRNRRRISLRKQQLKS